MTTTGRLPEILRYQLRQEGHVTSPVETWGVYDAFTGQPVVIAGVPQIGLSTDDATQLAAFLNVRAVKGDRRIYE